MEVSLLYVGVEEIFIKASTSCTIEPLTPVHPSICFIVVRRGESRNVIVWVFVNRNQLIIGTVKSSLASLCVGREESYANRAIHKVTPGRTVFCFNWLVCV